MKWSYSLRELRRRPLRSGLTLTGITIGVAAMLSIAITIETTRRAYGDMYTTLAGRAALEVVAIGDGGFDAALVDQLSGTDGVAVAAPVVQMPAVMIGPKGRLVVMVIGIDPERDTAVRDLKLRAGKALAPGGAVVLLDAAFAAANGIGVGDDAPVITRTGGVRLTVCGLMEPGPISAFNAGAVVVMPLSTAKKRFGLGDQINSVQLVLEDDDRANAIRQAVQTSLPDGLSVRPPAARADLVRDTLLSTEQALQSFSIMSLVAGAFIILNTFLMNLAERRRQLALIRALGGTGKQVQWWLLREALLLGLTGTAIGIPLGWLMSFGMLGSMQTLMGVKLSAPVPGVMPFVAAAILGPVMALAATWVPARRAGREPPLNGLTAAAGTDAIESVRRWPLVVGVICITLMAGICVILVGEHLPQRSNEKILPAGMALLMIGGILVMPYLLMPVLRMVVWGLGPFMGFEGRMAARHLDRRRVRTALTAGVLFVAIVISIGFGNQIRSNLRDMDTWYERTFVGD
ncbi:MAG: hypothetical protein CMJ83_18520 [Planctomycetes bacterium]|nr:hypothetical protein [Planctomycetota bacterium]